MRRLRHTVEQILAKLREAEVALSKGQPVAQACRTLGITEQTYDRWRNEYGGLKIDGGRPITGFARTVPWATAPQHLKPSRRNAPDSHEGWYNHRGQVKAVCGHLAAKKTGPGIKKQNFLFSKLPPGGFNPRGSEKDGCFDLCLKNGRAVVSSFGRRRQPGCPERARLFPLRCRNAC